MSPKLNREIPKLLPGSGIQTRKIIYSGMAIAKVIKWTKENNGRAIKDGV